MNPARTLRSSRPTTLWVLLALIVSIAPSAAAAEATVYGESLTPFEAVRIADLLADPERYLGQTVKVEGLVEDVCPKKGCWIDILEKQSAETIRFKVEDDVIVFPAEAKGNEVVAEGVFGKRELTHDQAISWMRHLAEEKGEAFDEASVTGPMVIYQIEGIGAEVAAR